MARRDLTAHGQTIDGLAGQVLTVEGHPAETQPGWRTAGTTLGGVFAALGILAAVHRRDRGLERRNTSGSHSGIRRCGGAGAT